MANYHHATYTPTKDEMAEAWVYMQYAESVAGEDIAKAQAANFFAEERSPARNVDRG